MRRWFALALFVAQPVSCVWASDQWQLYEDTGSARTEYAVGASKRMDGLRLVEFKLMSVQLKQRGLLVLDQYVATCGERQGDLKMLLKVSDSIHQHEGGAIVRTVASKRLNPPEEVSLADRGGSARVGATICGALAD